MTRTTFNRLREVKDSLPHGSMDRIAEEVGMSGEEVRSFFRGETSDHNGIHMEQGPEGGVIEMDNTRILEVALRLAWESKNGL